MILLDTGYFIALFTPADDQHDREAELALLERHYRGAGAALVPIHGRRRVGKSRLIEQFVRDKPHFTWRHWSLWVTSKRSGRLPLDGSARSGCFVRR